MSFLVLTACGGVSKSPVSARPPHEDALPVGSGEDEAEASSEPVHHRPSAPGPDLVRSPTATLSEAQRRALRDAVQAGRAAFGEQDYATADAHFRRALDIESRSSRLRCEAGYVAFRAGDVERGERQIERALRSMPDPSAAPDALRVPLAMCLYNAGLIFAVRDRPEDAREAWQQSLALRPNRTVRERLRSLGQPPRPQRTHMTLDANGVWTSWARAIRDGWCDEHSDWPEEGESCDDIEVSVQAPSGVAQGLDARLLRLDVGWAYGPVIAMLLVRSGDTVSAYPLVESPGGENDELRIIRFELADLDGRPGTEVRLDLEERAMDVDFGCDLFGMVRRHLVFCAADNGGAQRCAQVPVSRDDSLRQDCGEEDAPTEHQGFEVETSFFEGQLTIRRSATSVGDPPDGLIGRRRLEEMLSEPGFAVSPL